MDIQGLIVQTGIQKELARQELAQCNEKSAQYGFSFTEKEITGLAEQRIETLKEMSRIEFGQGQLVEMVAAFCSSPYLDQASYAETISELQRIFYQLKEESDEKISDEELIEAMRLLFDTEAHGSLDYFDGVSSQILQAVVERGRQDAYEDWSEEETYQKKSEVNVDALRKDETTRLYEGEDYDRPDNEYADNFYNAYDDFYQKRFDFNSRIGGSGL